MCGLGNETLDPTKKSLLVIYDHMTRLSLNSSREPFESLLVIDKLPMPIQKEAVAVIQVLSSFPYKSNKAIPWKCGINI